MKARTFPAGSGEKMQCLAHEFNDSTIRFIISYPHRINTSALSRAAKKVIESIDVLHSSFSLDNGAYWQVNADYQESDYFTCTESDENPLEEAFKASVFPIEFRSKTQLKVTLAQSEDRCAVCVTMSHLCVDGGDGRYLLGKIIEAYNLIELCGSADSLIVKNGNRASEQMYDRLSRKQYLSLMRSPLTGVKSVFPFPSDKPAAPSIITASIPHYIMEKARLRARSSGATANDLILAACYHGFGALDGIDPYSPMSIMSMMDLRRHCDGGDTKGICNLAGSLPTVLRKGLGKNLEDTLSQAAKQTQRLKEDEMAGLLGMPLIHTAVKAFPLKWLIVAARMVYSHMSLGLTNLGNVESDSLMAGSVRPDALYFGGPLKKKPNAQVSAISLDGACSLSIVGEYDEEDKKLLTAMLSAIVNEITEYSEG